MELDIPIYKNPDDFHCAAVTLKGIIEYLLKKELSLEELDGLMHFKDGSWTIIEVCILSDLGLKAKLYSTFDYTFFFKKEEKDMNNEERYIFSSVTPFLKTCWQRVQNEGNFIRKKLSWNNVEKLFDKGKIILINFDINKLYNLRKEGYRGHLIVLTGYDADNVYINEVDKDYFEKNKKIPKDKFISCWDFDFNGNEIITVEK